MTKEVLEKAKALDNDIAVINELLKLLNNNSYLTIKSDLTGEEVRFLNLDNETVIQLKGMMKEVLTKRKMSIVNELKEL